MTKSEIKNVVEITMILAFVGFILFTEPGATFALELSDNFFNNLFNLFN